MPHESLDRATVAVSFVFRDARTADDAIAGLIAIGVGSLRDEEPDEAAGTTVVTVGVRVTRERLLEVRRVVASHDPLAVESRTSAP